MTWSYDLISDIDNFQRTVEGPRTPWDTLILNGLAVSGVVRVTASIDTGTESQKAKGSKRAYIVDNGSNPVKFSISIELQPGELPEFYKSTVPLLRPSTKDGGQPRLKIQHPEAALWGVRIIKVTDIQSAPPVSGGTKTITIKAMEDVGSRPNKKKNKVKVERDLSRDPRPDANLTRDLKNDLWGVADMDAWAAGGGA